jgi:LEA14-like dessication related protein
MKSKSFALVGIFLFLVLSGCATMTQLREPRMQIESVGLARLDGKTAHVVFHGKLFNPNKVKLEMDGVDYALKVNDEEVVRSEWLKKLEIAPEGEVSFDMPMQFSLNQVFKSLLGALQNKQVRYDLKGSVRVGLFSVPFRKDGEIVLH